MKKNILQIIIIVLLVILVLMVFGFGVYYIADNKVNDEIGESNSNNDKNDNSSTDKTEVDSFDISKFDTTMEAINSENDKLTFKPLVSISNSTGISAKLNTDKKSVIVTIDWSKYSNLYNGGSSFSGVMTTDIRNYNIIDFDKTIKDVYIKGFNSSSGFETIIYLMNDGTVEYTPIQKELNNRGITDNGILKSYGKIKDVSDVIAMIDATGEYPDYLNSVAGGNYILAVKADGKFYNLNKLLEKTGNY